MTVYHKPSGFVKAMNAFVGRLASMGLIPGDTAMLQVKGRRSGEMRSTAVTWVEHEGQRYLGLREARPNGCATYAQPAGKRPFAAARAKT
jgi:hypothetical protein